MGIVSKLVATGCVMGLTAAVSAGTITQDFSVGYGYSLVGGVSSWNTSETAAYNTLPTGDIQLTVSVTGEMGSTTGPSFINARKIGTGTVNQGPPGTYSGRAHNFGATFTADYTGILPENADPASVQITINISKISIYATSQDTAGTNNLGFKEVTADHLASQNLVTIAAGPSYAWYGPYTQVVWDTSNGLANFAGDTRSFGLNFNGQLFLDGFEVFGTVEVSYTEIPEPMSLGLMGLGSLALLKRRR